MYVRLNLCLLFTVFSTVTPQDYGTVDPLRFRQDPAPDGHRLYCKSINTTENYDYLCQSRPNQVTCYSKIPSRYKSFSGRHLVPGCGICPTYFQKICAFDSKSNSTFIFDNHCVMDLYNCIEGAGFFPMKYEKCLFFGNFAYVHGYKYEDMDYGEDHVIVKQSKKNPDFIR